MDIYDSLQEKLAKRKSEVLEIEYQLFLERKKPDLSANPKKIEKLLFKRKFALIAFGEAANLAGKTWEYYSISSAVRDYIRSKGHEPKRSKALLAIAIIFGGFTLGGLASGSAVGVLFFATIAAASWIWWANFKSY